MGRNVNENRTSNATPVHHVILVGSEIDDLIPLRKGYIEGLGQ